MQPSTASADATSQIQRGKHNRSVHFESYVQGVQVPSLDGMPACDKQRMWHSVSALSLHRIIALSRTDMPCTFRLLCSKYAYFVCSYVSPILFFDPTNPPPPLRPIHSKHTQREEYAVITKNLRDEARYMRLSRTAPSLDSSGTLLCTEDEIWCSRGIEHLLSKKILLKLERSKQKVVKSILDEQSQQHLDDAYDPNRIADISLELSAEAKERAINRAKDDAFYVAE